MNYEEYHVLNDARPTRNQDKSHEELLIRYNLIENALLGWERRICPPAFNDGKSYHAVPIGSGIFVDILIDGFLALGMTKGKRFLDVGCGAGVTLLLARTFFEANGFDINERLISKAQSFVGERAFKQDAMEYSDYGEFDFIYYFRPIYDDDLYLQLEKKIYNSLRPGSIVCPMIELFDWRNQPDIEQLSDFIYQKS